VHFLILREYLTLSASRGSKLCTKSSHWYSLCGWVIHNELTVFTTHWKLSSSTNRHQTLMLACGFIFQQRMHFRGKPQGFERATWTITVVKLRQVSGFQDRKLTESTLCLLLRNDQWILMRSVIAT